MDTDISVRALAAAGCSIAPSTDTVTAARVPPNVTIICMPGPFSLPAEWKAAWLAAGWRVDEVTSDHAASFALSAPAIEHATMRPRKPANDSRADPPIRARSGQATESKLSHTHGSTASGASLLSRSAFLSHLSDVMQQPEQGCCALMSIRIDQSATAAQADRTAMFGLEEKVCERVLGLLDHGDLMTIWLELGFGVLVQRDESASVWDLASRMCARIAAEPFDIDGMQVALTASIGLTLAPRGPLVDGGHPWFASAYAAQALAHRHGGNRTEGLLTREFEPMPADRVLIIREWVNEAKTGGNVLIEYRSFMPMKPSSPPLHCVQAKLRDLRAPLRGVYRGEYLRLARVAGAMVMIDRMSLFQAFQTLEQEHTQNRATRLMVPIDAATLRGMHWRWLEAELRRRSHLAGCLVIELDADSELANDETVASMTQLRRLGVHISLVDESPDLSDIPTWARLPADFLRVSASIVEGMSAAEFARRLSAWRVRERRLIVDGVSDIKSMMLNGINPDYLGGDAIAIVGPRLEHEFNTVV